MSTDERPLIEEVSHREGRCGGFCFGGARPERVEATAPLPEGITFPNGARAAFLLTFDVEGTYGNGTGNLGLEIANYERICARLRANHIPATFFVVGQMAEEHGKRFLPWMEASGSEVGCHGYVHDLNRRYGGDRVYAGHYGERENREQVEDGLRALNRLLHAPVRGFRLPYGHFNEYSYAAIAAAGITYASHMNIESSYAGRFGFGPRPFRPVFDGQPSTLVEIPLDSETYDWAIWIADAQANRAFVEAARNGAAALGLELERTPRGAAALWMQRLDSVVSRASIFTFLCHPTNLALTRPGWGDPVETFLFPVIDRLGALAREGAAWVCTGAQMADFYTEAMRP